jgi:hypothetical protein
MKQEFLLLLASTIFFIECTNSIGADNSSSTQKGIVKGRVTDTQGRPMANVDVVIENTVFYASYVNTRTNAAGNYSVSVPAGSWKALVRINYPFLGKTYQFDLHPDDASPFAGTTGAIRNFTWKLSGEKPDGTGFYGSDIAVYSQPGSSFSREDVEITLVPDGTLADGSKGKTITKTLTALGGGEDGIRDLPIGKYIISARNKTKGKALQVRLRNKGEYRASVAGIFSSGYTGITNYQIAIQVQDKDDL